MSQEFKQVTATFANNDILTLTLKECDFYGFVKGKVFELAYGEYCKGSYDGSTDKDCHYLVCNTEYFKSDNVYTAVQAFSYRLHSDEAIATSPFGTRLEQCLDRKEY